MDSSVERMKDSTYQIETRQMKSIKEQIGFTITRKEMSIHNEKHRQYLGSVQVVDSFCLYAIRRMHRSNGG